MRTLITHDEVCAILRKTKRQIARYRAQGLPDYGGCPLMFDKAEVEQFIESRRAVKKPPETDKEVFERGRAAGKLRHTTDPYERGRLKALSRK
jgi:hypothetical protein